MSSSRVGRRARQQQGANTSKQHISRHTDLGARAGRGQEVHPGRGHGAGRGKHNASRQQGAYNMSAAMDEHKAATTTTDQKGKVRESEEGLTTEHVDVVRRSGAARSSGNRRRTSATVGEDEDHGEAAGRSGTGSFV